MISNLDYLLGFVSALLYFLGAGIIGYIIGHYDNDKD